MTNDAQNQSYDNLLKRLVENQPRQILPLLFPGLISEVLEELNIEVLIPPRRVDRVYKTRPGNPEDGLQILHFEYEVSFNPNMDTRLLACYILVGNSLKNGNARSTAAR